MGGSERLASRDETGRQTCCNSKYAFAKLLWDSEKQVTRQCSEYWRENLVVWGKSPLRRPSSFSTPREA